MVGGYSYSYQPVSNLGLGLWAPCEELRGEFTCLYHDRDDHNIWQGIRVVKALSSAAEEECAFNMDTDSNYMWGMQFCAMAQTFALRGYLGIIMEGMC